MLAHLARRVRRISLSQPSHGRCRARLVVELLEARTLLSGSGPLTPLQVRHAYGFDLLPLSTNDGSGQTIAIIDAYANPNIGKDLDTFDQAYGVAAGKNLYQQYGGAGSVLTTHAMAPALGQNANWAHETALDVEWAHAIAPGARIMLVEAASGSLPDLLSAVDYATSNGANVVSMSWGTAEFPTETASDSHFNHSGITYVASAGDTASTTQWPAVSPNVLAVGGTTLLTNPMGTWQDEAAWNQSGGGVSAYEAKPGYQANVPQSALQRTSPDVAYDANPLTGFAVYDTADTGAGWGASGGTSAGAPQWAGLIAIADQGRSGSLGSAQTLSTVYDALSSTNVINATYFHDIPAPGYDLATGLGTPQAAQLIALLRSGSTPTLAGTTGSSGGPKVTPVSQSGQSAPTPTAASIVAAAEFNLIFLATVTQPAPLANPAAQGAVPLALAPALPGPAPLSAPGLSLNNRVESGGGDNGLLAAPVGSADGPDLIPAPVLDPDVTPDLGVPAWSTPAPQEAIALQEAHATYFAADEWGGEGGNVRLALPETGTEPVVQTFDPAASLACLAVVLGGFCGSRTDDSERRSHSIHG
jgi:hypothetical protein